MTSLFSKVETWFRKPEPASEKCALCGLLPGKEYIVPSDDPILHPHKCARCQSVVYVPGAMFMCDDCSEERQRAS